MKVVEFPEQNIVFTWDHGPGLPARRFEEDGFSIVESRWIPSDAERQAIADGAAIALRLVATNPQPSLIVVVHNGKEVVG
jgi:hypothetical protein